MWPSHVYAKDFFGLASVRVDRDHMTRLDAQMKENKARSFFLSSCTLEVRTLMDWMDQFHTYSLTEIDFRYLDLGFDGCMHVMSKLVEVIERIQLENLYLDSMQIGDEGACSIAKVLKTSRLSSLHLINCGIESRGGLALADGLRHSNVSTLTLSSNLLGKDAMIALANALPQTSISTLKLVRLGITGTREEVARDGSIVLIALAQALQHSPHVKSLVLDIQGVSSPRTTWMYQVLAETTQIQSLQLRLARSITDEEVRVYIIPAIVKMESLRRLDLDCYGSDSDTVCTELLYAIRAHPNLIDVYVSDYHHLAIGTRITAHLRRIRHKHTKTILLLCSVLRHSNTTVPISMLPVELMRKLYAAIVE